ncbi:MAG: Rrf2 family transcriptional regulator [Bdellovibrionota bacterium]
MRISSLEEYGLRCALQLARYKLKSELASASLIAELEGLSVEYVSKIMHLFRRGGLVQSTRGIQGGFALAKIPSEVSVKEVLDVLAVSQKSPESVEGFCAGHSGVHEVCVHRSSCQIKPVWSYVFDAFDRVLSGITVADLIEGSPSLMAKLRVEPKSVPQETVNVQEQKNESI